MDIGLIFAILAAVSFAGNMVYIRKGTLQAGESFTAMTVGVFVGTLLFALSLTFSSGWEKLWSLSGYGLALLGIAGILNFAVGRFLVYSAIRLIGANRTSTLVGTATFYPVILGVLLLNESFTINLGLGVLGIVAGVTLISTRKEEEITKMRGRGIIIGLAGAFCLGMSAVLVKSVIEEVGSPSAAAFVSFMTAALVMGVILLWRKGQRSQLTHLRRAALIPLVIGGIFAAIGQLFRYLALSYSPVSVVIPLISISVLFVFLLSFLLNRRIEVFTWRVFTGMVAIVVGSFLLFY